VTLTTIGWVLFISGLIGLAAIGLLKVIDLAGRWVRDLIGWWDRRADRAIAAQIDAALCNSPDWVDGSHDRVRLSMCERATLEDLERRLEETR
jgi:hypothetical protein